MGTRLLEVDTKAIKFICEVKKQSTSSVHLTNVSDQYVAFKVKTTSPKRFCVRPNSGIISPKSSCDFSVTMQGLRSPASEVECKDKFLIQSTVVDPETKEEDVTLELFSKSSGKYVEDKKLRVILINKEDSLVEEPKNKKQEDPPIEEHKHKKQDPPVEEHKHKKQDPPVEEHKHKKQDPLVEEHKHKRQDPLVEEHKHKRQESPVEEHKHKKQESPVEEQRNKKQDSLVEEHKHKKQDSPVKEHKHKKQDSPVKEHKHKKQDSPVKEHKHKKQDSPVKEHKHKKQDSPVEEHKQKNKDLEQEPSNESLRKEEKLVKKDEHVSPKHMRTEEVKEVKSALRKEEPKPSGDHLDGNERNVSKNLNKINPLKVVKEDPQRKLRLCTQLKDLKLKESTLENQLKEAKSTISTLTYQNSKIIEAKEILQMELTRRSKKGFSFVSVCLVSLTGVIVGYFSQF